MLIEEDGLLTWEQVQERLVEAVTLARQMPDRERGWLRVRAFWPDMRRHNHFGDYGDFDAPPRTPPLSRAQIARMDEAFGWLDAVEPSERKLVGLAVGRLASGAAQVPWLELRAPMGVRLGAGGLRMRYERTIGAICKQVNARTC